MYCSNCWKSTSVISFFLHHVLIFLLFFFSLMLCQFDGSDSKQKLKSLIYYHWPKTACLFEVLCLSLHTDNSWHYKSEEISNFKILLVAKGHYFLPYFSFIFGKDVLKAMKIYSLLIFCSLPSRRLRLSASIVFRIL